ncbi:DUF2911 domain-containing protein [Owenweeksia hongkongensis]|uniref:DUF2911 domain-containing protein n=1 Tax=Owenweeksia hongkongensis TaxID=253245 RepID=UPI003A907D65
MKLKLLALSILAAFTFNSNAQHGDKQKRQSPPATMEHKVGDASITINYSQPSVKGREIFGELVPFGKVWRTGANEATTFTTDKDITIGGQKLAAGTYALLTIPGKDEWTVILNTEAKQWGAYKYDEEKDAVRFTVKPVSHDMTEAMTFSAKKNTIYLDWAETRVPMAVK